MKLDNKNIVLGADLIILDVLIWDGKLIPVGYYVGGTCGNVMMILYLSVGYSRFSYKNIVMKTGNKVVSPSFL